MGLLRLRQGQYQGLPVESDALKVSRRVFEMAEEYREEVWYAAASALLNCCCFSGLPTSHCMHT